MEKQVKGKSNKGKRSKIALKQPRGLSRGVRKNPSESPLHNYEDIYAGNSTESLNKYKSPRTIEDILSGKGNFWGRSPAVKKLTPTSNNSSVLNTPVTPMRDYTNSTNVIDMRVNQGISPNFTNQILKQIMSHGETVAFPSTSTAEIEIEQELGVTTEHEIISNYEASSSAPQIAYKTPENQAETSKGAQKRRHKSKGCKQPRKMFRTSAKTLQEIKKYQKSTDFPIPKKSFQRLCREIFDKNFDGLRITPQALAALQEIAETHLVNTLEEGNRCALHAKRVTIMPKDIRLALRLKKQ